MWLSLQVLGGVALLAAAAALLGAWIAPPFFPPALQAWRASLAPAGLCLWN